MAPLFLFGSLQHGPLLEAVIGRTDHLKQTPAQVCGFVVEKVAEGPFPMIVQKPGARANGLLLEGLSQQDMASLDFYEGAFEYTRSEVTLADGRAAQAYFPKQERWTPGGLWSLEDWAHDWGALSVLAAREAMTYRGTKSAVEVGEMFPMIRARAWSYMNARKSCHDMLTLTGHVEVSEKYRPYANYFAVDEYHLRFDTFDGEQSDEVMRAVFLSPDAALVLPYDPHRDRVMVVEQMRMGPLARGDRYMWQLEPIAGRLDPGETPETAARREALEEAGLVLGELETIAETYCSPGNSSEFHYIFLGLTDLPDTAAGNGGVEAEHEDIRAHLIDFEQLMRMCETAKIVNGPLFAASYWLAHHRNRLRADAGVSD